MKNEFSLSMIKEYLLDIGKWDDFSQLVKRKQRVTIVTGLWDLGRSQLEGWAHRDFETYKYNFFKLLESDIPMCIWIPRSLEQDVWNIRSRHNTEVYFRETEDFKTWFPFFEQHEKLRINPLWTKLAGWLETSPQAALQLYNPMMMSKLFMVNDSAIINPFNSQYFYWVDGGLTTTVPQHYFLSGNIFTKIASEFNKKILHVAYPYEPSTEIHGFEKHKMFEYCGLDSATSKLLISRGGFWGGPKELIHTYNNLYYELLSKTIADGYIGADECLFTILAYKHPELISRVEIEGNGLMWPFFETAKEYTTNNIDKQETNLYVLGFNSPKQFEKLCESFKDADINFLEKPRKILINNSTDTTTFDEYDRLCERYGFEEIHKDNIGVCGGRQFAAEHFYESGAEFHIFFEDDMNLKHPSENTPCKMGMIGYVPSLYGTLHKIMRKTSFDFLKISFSEFYGDNSVQWAWYNVPQIVRTEIWPENDKLPIQGLSDTPPRTKFSTINNLDGVSFITGEIYYSNWPQIVSRAGTKKMFLDTRWDRPYEQTWMSHMYQMSRKNELFGAVLLASPINHHRFEHYEASLRKES